MQNRFYSSGFFYDSATGHILLKQLSTDDTAPLELFKIDGQKGENPLAIFQTFVEKTLGISLKTSTIFPVYDYEHETLGYHFIFYVDVTGGVPSDVLKKHNANWFPLAKLSKLNLSEQASHDIVVGERVIRATHEKNHPTPNLHH